MRKRLASLIILGAGFGVGATALAQGGGSQLRLDLPTGCLSGTLVTVNIQPASGSVLNSVRVRVSGRDEIRLSGVSQRATVVLRLHPEGGRVTVSGDTLGGRRFSQSHLYRRCAPKPANTPATHRPPPVTGGGEG